MSQQLMAVNRRRQKRNVCTSKPLYSSIYLSMYVKYFSFYYYYVGTLFGHRNGTMPINITLPNGRTVDAETKQGANYFIQDPSGPFEFFSQNLEHVQQVCDRVHRRRNKTPTPQEINEISLVYAMAHALAENADEDVFAKIPEEEIRCYMEHVLFQMGRMSEDNSNWARTGNLRKYHEDMMLEGLIGLFRHSAPTKLAFEMDFFEALQKFASAPSSIAADPAETITMIVANAVISTLVFKEELPTTAKAFAKLESSGMLEQFIRLSVVNPVTSPGVLKCYDQLNACTSLIQKKFTDDQPCGKACKEILGRSSLHLHPVVSELRKISSFTSFIEQRADLPKGMKDGYKHCRKCNKLEHSLEFQRGLQKCSRCKSAWYCSRECQVSDVSHSFMYCSCYRLSLNTHNTLYSSGRHTNNIASQFQAVTQRCCYSTSKLCISLSKRTILAS